MTSKATHETVSFISTGTQKHYFHAVSSTGPRDPSPPEILRVPAWRVLTSGCVVAEFTIAKLPSSSFALWMCVTKSLARHGQIAIVALQLTLLSLSHTSMSRPPSTIGLY